MSSNGIIYSGVQDYALITKLTNLVTEFLTDDKNLSFRSFDHIVSESNDKVDVYEVVCVSDDGMSVVEVALFSNGTSECKEY